MSEYSETLKKHLNSLARQLIEADDRKRLLSPKKRRKLESGVYNFAALVMCAEILKVSLYVGLNSPADYD